MATYYLLSLLTQKMPSAPQEVTSHGLPLPRLSCPGLSGPRKASQYMSVVEQAQLQLLDQGSPILLTEEALRQHDMLTTPTELRQFACRDCDQVWWRVVLSIKMVSRCKGCVRKYDALPRHKEYGIGRFTCPECTHVFYSRCHANTSCPCYECGCVVSKPYVHPGNKLNAALNKSNRKHSCDLCHGMGKCPNYKRVVYASLLHVSTCSSVNTWLSQPDYNDPAPYFDFAGSDHNNHGNHSDHSGSSGRGLSPIASGDEGSNTSSHGERGSSPEGD